MIHGLPMCVNHIYLHMRKINQSLVPTDIEKTVTAALKVVLTDSKSKNQTIFILHFFFFLHQGNPKDMHIKEITNTI